MRPAAGAGEQARGQPFPWQEAMHAGLGRLRLSPRDFWAMTPRELALAIAAPRYGVAPSRSALGRMMALFPD
ncbi:rcc01693 family protein [Hartmannibacter diazotrophicus]|uniref:rcc01693 family protein n=1 Tax=Hartmannibacter diazotrophicus TaxID=1482074 RepID=UPI0012FE77E3|nr:rcc01693 family protein [Hartmannibacter diazotrophicus]